ncbi:hypothetical protein AMATHDRAFT_149066 [Amanita thiersii Skay4041]|uniref:Cytochrome P450 n=1 Tax=Amanita thiersii Skay4041 TaxID=703135 RepID=A0A2A9NFF9_9AGAR|nr:hypothetical protein AMATHDRAFT_149066 [Amanita thiersii Skay4041]
MPLYLFATVVFTFVGIAHFFHTRSKWKSNPKNLPLPPGPRGLPIVGSLFNVPTERNWLVFSQWSKIYGDMIYYKVLGRPYLILGSYKRVYDLGERRSSIYSSRTDMPMLKDLMKWGFNLAILPYGAQWRLRRRKFHDYFHPNIVSRYQPIQLEWSHKFLHLLLETPQNFLDHIRYTFSSIILEICYGFAIERGNDAYVKKVEQSMEGFSQAVVFGSFLVDHFPVLKHIPGWMPGAGFKKKAEEWRRANIYVEYAAFNIAKEGMADGTGRPSIATDMLQSLPADADAANEAETIARQTLATAYVGAADTTLSTVQSLFLAMAMHPEVQRNAQEEIDTIVGSKRLPDFTDRSSLPYINAIAKEAMRWQPVLPLGTPHMTTQDDEYEGYFIPKGTIVMGNTWAILHNEEMFPDPEVFRPERFLSDTSNLKVSDIAFGFGRRACPGRFFSDASLFIIVASVLSVFDILPPVDEDGRPIHLKAESIDGILTHPVPFECIIKPRSKNAESLIRNSKMVGNTRLEGS